MTRYVTLLAAAMLVGGPALMAQKTGNAERMTNSVPASDRMFMEKAAQGGMAEVQMGQLAKDHA